MLIEKEKTVIRSWEFLVRDYPKENLNCVPCSDEWKTFCFPYIQWCTSQLRAALKHWLSLSGVSLASFKYSSVVQLLSHVWLFVTPWIAACQASLPITNSWSSPKLTSIESVMPSSHLILCRPLLFLPPIPPIIRVFSNESTLRMRWPKYWSFSFSISLSKEHPDLL